MSAPVEKLNYHVMEAGKVKKKIDKTRRDLLGKVDVAVLSGSLFGLILDAMTVLTAWKLQKP
jgi:hypothetical protein